MMPWRKIAVVGAVAGLMLGCTITTSDGKLDGGAMDETGGSGSQGGAGATGGTATNGGTTAVSTVIACNPAAETPATCGYCLQRPDNPTDGADPGMCDEYLPCANTAGCTATVNAMATCMSTKAVNNIVPSGADAECRASTAGMAASDTSAAAVAAQTFWTAISNSIWCATDCWAEGT